MVMIRPKGKASQIATAVLKGKGVKVQSGDKVEKKNKDKMPYLVH